MDIDWSKVKTIYYGKDAWCRCGCGGTYHEPGSKGFARYMNKFNSFMPVMLPKLEWAEDKTWVNLSLANNKAITLYFE